MLRAKFALLALIPVLAAASCSAETGDQPAETDLSIEARPALIGTFKSDTFTVGALVQLVLKTDGTFHSGKVIACAGFTTPCDPAQQDGVYRLSSRDSYQIMSFYDPGGTLLERYQYEIAGDSLRLRRLEMKSAWRTLERANVAWCAAPSDCALQNLPVGPCAGTWMCEENACSYTCRPVAAAARGESSRVVE